MQAEFSRDQRVKSGRLTAALPVVTLMLLVSIVCSISLWVGRSSLSDDPDSYAQLAETLANTGTFGVIDPQAVVHPTAYRPVLYPWLLHWFVVDGHLHLSYVAVFHATLISVIAIGVWDIARKLQFRWPYLPAILVAVDPLLLRATQQVMTELLATVLGVAVWWLWLVIWPPNSACSLTAADKQRSKRQWVSLYSMGLAFGLSILARPTAAIWVAMFSICMLRIGCVCWKRRLLDAVTVCLGVIICVAPWTLRNWSIFGQPIWGTTHGGYTLLLANNPSIYQHFKDNGPQRDWQAERFHAAWAARGKVERSALFEDKYWAKNPRVEATAGTKISTDNEKAETARPSDSSLIVYSLGEIQDDQLACDIAHDTIHRRPLEFAKSCVYRLGWFWSCWPAGVGGIQTAVIGTWYCIVFCLAFMGLRSRLGNLESFLASWLPALVLLIVLSGVHSVYWSNMRMRCPLMPCVYLLAVVGVHPQRPAKGESRRREQSAND